MPTSSPPPRPRIALFPAVFVMAPKAKPAKAPVAFVAKGITAAGRSKTYKRRGGSVLNVQTILYIDNDHWAKA